MQILKSEAKIWKIIWVSGPAAVIMVVHAQFEAIYERDGHGIAVNSEKIVTKCSFFKRPCKCGHNGVTWAVVR